MTLTSTACCGDKVAGFRDPVSQGLYRPSAVETLEYLDELVALLPEDAAFASAEVFDG